MREESSAKGSEVPPNGAIVDMVERHSLIVLYRIRLMGLVSLLGR